MAKGRETARGASSRASSLEAAHARRAPTRKPTSGANGIGMRRGPMLLFPRPVDPQKLRELLEQVRKGARSTEEALAELKDLPYADLGYATVDHHRALRQGAPEVVFGHAKTAAQIAGIAAELARTGQNVLIT